MESEIKKALLKIQKNISLYQHIAKGISSLLTSLHDDGWVTPEHRKAMTKLKHLLEKKRKIERKYAKYLGILRVKLDRTHKRQHLDEHGERLLTFLQVVKPLLDSADATIVAEIDEAKPQSRSSPFLDRINKEERLSLEIIQHIQTFLRSYSLDESDFFISLFRRFCAEVHQYSLAHAAVLTLALLGASLAACTKAEGTIKPLSVQTQKKGQARVTGTFHHTSVIAYKNGKWTPFNVSTASPYPVLLSPDLKYAQVSIDQGVLVVGAHDLTLSSASGQFQPDIASNHTLSFLLSDIEFGNSKSMTEEHIRQFLSSKNSGLLRIPGIDAPKLILDACKRFQINPKLILAKLQVEQALVEFPNFSQKEIDFALGLGARDDKRISDYKGFKKQILAGAEHFRIFFNTGKTLRYPYTMKGMNYNGKYKEPTEIEVLNAATYALYTWTPHDYNHALGKQRSQGGNALFLRVYDRYSAEIAKLQAK